MKYVFLTQQKLIWKKKENYNMDYMWNLKWNTVRIISHNALQT